MGCDNCVSTQKENQTNLIKEKKSADRYYQDLEDYMSEYETCSTYNASSEKIEEWEEQYHAWASYRGDEDDGPPRPGLHPNPKHYWNKYPGKFRRLEDIDEADDEGESVPQSLIFN